MDGPRGYYAKKNKSDRERQIPYDLTHMLNLKNKTKQKKTYRFREQTGLLVSRGEELRGCLDNIFFLCWWK